MIGITSYGAYVPFHRLERAEIAQFWGGYKVPGEKAVANFDEDTVTMGVEACRNCLKDRDKATVDGLYFCSTTAPYAEKQSSALLATVLDLDKTVRTIDLAGSIRSGMNAIKLAADSVAAGASHGILVCGSDMRMGRPNGAKEMEFGDGAAALLIGDSDVIATIDAWYTVHNELYDVYRSATDRYVQSWEDRFVREVGFTRVVPQTVAEALKKFGMKPGDFTAAVISASNPTFLGGVAKKIGLDPKTQAIDPLWGAVGYLGTAHPFMMLSAALEQAKPGDRFLWVSYGDGCDVCALTVTDKIAEAQKRRNLVRMIESKAPVTYQKYLRWRDMVELEPPMRPREEPPSAPALYRDRKCGLALYGSRCNNCGTIQYPVQRVCMECRSKDDFEYYPFADKVGKIVTFSHDNLAVSPDPPTTLAAIDFEEGGRIMMDVTDRKAADIEVGTQVEMTFRKFRHTHGLRVYWWKSRPVR